MSVNFDHLAIAARDKQRSASFLSSLLGLPEPDAWGPFVSVHLDDGVHLDYAEPGIEFPGQHYALLVSDDVFDRALASITDQAIPFSAGPKGPQNEIRESHRHDAAGLADRGARPLAGGLSMGDDWQAMGARLELRGADAESVLTFAGELAACDAAEQLSAQVSLLAPLVGADSVLISAFRDWARVVRIEVGDPDIYRPELLHAVTRRWRDHPVLTGDLACAARGARKLSDFVEARAWRRRRLFNDFYRPLGMTQEIATQLSWGPAGSSCCVAVHRAGRDFTERDRAALALLTSHLQAARARIAARALLAARLALLQDGLEGAGSGTLLVDRGGALAAVGTGGRDVLQRWFDARGGALPGELEHWWRDARADRAPAGFELARGERRLRARLLRGGDEDLILLTEQDSAALPPERLARALPITPREADVLALLAEGHTNDGIAHALGISRHTVIRHVEHLYAKLRVGTRAAATRLALDAVRDPADGWM